MARTRIENTAYGGLIQRTGGAPGGGGEAPTAVPFSGDVVEFASGVLGLDLDSKQAELLGTGARHVILNCSRQWGKSTMAAAKVAHRALARPGSLTVIASPSERQSGELVAKARQFLLAAGVKVKGDGRFKASIVTPNGSRVVGLPAKESTTRGLSKASLLIVDEASRVPDHIYHPLRPMLATSGGDVWLLSTPNGCEGFFYKTWTSGGDWFRVTATAEECPRISAEQLEMDRMEFSDAFFRQEYLCEFESKDTALFRRDKIAALEDYEFNSLQS